MIMNRALFITTGIVIIIFVFLVWLFLFVNGAPTNTREVFSDLGIVEPTPTPTRSSEEVDEREVLGLTDGVIQQITTEPVAGFRAASTSDGNVLRYVERGTGYIQEVKLNSGFKSQVSPRTFPNTVAAYFAPDLTSVVIVTEQSNRAVQLVEFPKNASAEVIVTSLDAAAENIVYRDADTLTYTRNTYTETVGYSYNRITQATAELFRIGIPDATVITTADTTVFAYPKPTTALTGAVYEVEGGRLIPYSDTHRGLMPFIVDAVGIITHSEATGNQNTSYRLPSNQPLDTIVIPEKCTGSGTIAWCGSAPTYSNPAAVEAWYKGVQAGDDTLVTIDTTTGAVTELVNLKNATGRQVDVFQPQYEPATEQLLFTNKIDGALWLLNL